VIDALSKIVPVVMLVFVISSMLAMGLSLTVREIAAPLRNVRLVLLALLANFVLMPLGAFGIARLLQLKEPLAAGLIVLGAAAGAPFLPKLAALAKGNMAFSVGLMVLLMVLTVGYMPLVLPMLLEGVTVDAAKIARSLVLLMLLPLGVGLAVKARLAAAAARVKPALDKTSNLSLILLIALLVVVNFDKMLDVFGTRGILAAVIFVVLGYALGHVLGGPALDTRRVLGLGTAQRNIAAALVVAGQNFSDPEVVLMVVVVAIVGLLILMPGSRALSRRG
jgi:BASS family bile acid:Na+ symporter